MTHYFDTASYTAPSDTKTPDEAVHALALENPIQVAMLVVNTELNSLIRGRDAEDGPVKYMGWYWRDVDFFAEGGISIADGGDEVRICQSNKWGYASRVLTNEERDEFLKHVWAAHAANHTGGILSEILAAVDAHLAAGFDYIASLDVPEGS